ncbi:MAG: hypothetical protein H6738_05765 [Alphaproteobacteria bacterium]|nr:hypothetical protein [Alphaproteobacteria bacterium]MCB9696273.1 hypothetical protein [Alphaproteobacteria bacterium]
MNRHADADATEVALSRADLEVLCVLYVIGTRGCPVLDVASRLGLSPSLAEAVAEGMNPLVVMGLLDRTEDGMFRVTEAGRSRLEDTLSDLGIASRPV